MAWYGLINQQLENLHDQLELIEFTLPIMKELGAKWLIKMAKFMADNPTIIVNGFIRAGIM